MPALPTGTVTFLLTDIEGSTGMLQRLGDAVYADVLAQHRSLLRSIFAENGGQEIGKEGDAFLVAFARAREALTAAVAAQRALATHAWPPGARLKVRIGLHTGEPASLAGDYVGLDVHRAARICAAAHGDQILLSGTTATLVAGSLPPEVTLRDMGMHRLKDLHQPEKIFQVVHPHLPTEFRPPKSLTTFANNLPRPLTSFIGRRREVAEVKQLLSTTRLLTLTGVGGCGKTRLAIQVASDVLEEYTDGVWFVELAALSDAAVVPKSMASAVGVAEEPGQPLMPTLLDALREKQLLIVLDNCEHLVAACAQLAEAVLRMCPAVGILATSREPLGIAGETNWRVPSLVLPDPQQHPSVVDLLECEAVRLFVERAAAVRPTFELTAESAPAVIAICQRLDGIPLAIELAAARVRALSIVELTARLDDRFRLLTGGSRTTLPRQQTLQATMDWSYQLLAEHERVMLRRLSVFAGRWTLEAAEAICADPDVSKRLDVLDLLTQLVYKSLVIMDPQEEEPRYYLLETVRQYGRGRLMKSPEAARVRDRHLAWYLALAERAEPELIGANQTTWLDRLELEHDNLRAALAWAVASGDGGSGLRLASALGRFWYVRCYFTEGRGWFDALLDTRIEVPVTVRAKALNAAGGLAVFGQGDYPKGRSFFEESLGIWREVGDRQNIAALLDRLGALFTIEGDYAAARPLYEESLTIRRELSDRWGIALSSNNLGFALYRQEDHAAAQVLFEESLAIWRELGDTHNIGRALSNIGLVAMAQGDYAAARSFLTESLNVRWKVGDKWGIAHSIEGLAGLAAQSQPTRAARLFGAVEALRESIHVPIRLSDRTEHEQRVAAVRARLSPDEFSTAWLQGRAMPLDRAIKDAMEDGETTGAGAASR
jgi:predicted ATPase/class 3 adenylate cyclase/Tfp pilus assembly protein PilF